LKLEETLRALYDEEVEFVIIGGAAMQLQGSAYITEDLDFCYERSPNNLQKLARALEPFHPRLRNAPADLPFRFDSKTIERGLNFTLVTDLGALDFLGEVAGLGPYSTVKAVSETMQVFGLDHQVLNLEGLIKAKRAAGRPKDLEALKDLEGLLDLRKRTGM
jgi:predicted nucleotidyltransferase